MKKCIQLVVAITILLNTFIFSTQAAETRPVSFLQQDAKWGFELYSITGNPIQTIADGGCGPTAMAMVLNHYIDSSITPIQTAMYGVSRKHQTVSSGTSWTYFEDMANEYNLEFFQTHSSSEAKQWMLNKDNALMICSMGPGLWTVWGHYILVWKIENDIVYINDPYSLENIKSKNSYSYMSSQCKQFFCFNQKVKKDSNKNSIVKIKEKNKKGNIIIPTPFNIAE